MKRDRIVVLNAGEVAQIGAPEEVFHRPANPFVATFMGALRATTPVDPDRPVMVAGDPQWKLAEIRMRDGIPVGPGLMGQVRQIAQAAAAPWLLD